MGVRPDSCEADIVAGHMYRRMTSDSVSKQLDKPEKVTSILSLNL